LPRGTFIEAVIGAFVPYFLPLTMMQTIMLTLGRASLAVVQPNPTFQMTVILRKLDGSATPCGVRTSGCGLVANRIESADEDEFVQGH